MDTTLDDQPIAQISVPPALRKALPTLAGRGDEGGEGGEGGEGERSSTLSITALPPLSLRLRLPAAYPSRSPPVFGVRCAWLSDESLSTLCERLDAECAAAAGTAVICDLVEWLRTEALRALPADTLSPLRLPSEAGTEAGAEAAAAAAATNGGAAAATSKAASSSATASAAERLRGRAARWPRDDAEVLSSIIAHAQAADEAAWRDGLHDCGVCLETHASLTASASYAADTFCKACRSGYFAAQMAERRVRATVPRAFAACVRRLRRSCCSRQALRAYERLSLQTTLETMSDICWCPRCEFPAFLLDGEGGRLALCSTCHFSFCTECKQSWHGLSPCANLATRWRHGSEAERAALRAKYGDKVLDEVQSSEWMLSNTKPCPNCSTSIQEWRLQPYHMPKVQHEWCWLCPSAITRATKNGNCEQFSDDFLTRSILRAKSLSSSTSF